MKILQAKNLKKIYGSGNNVVHALDGVDLSVEKGEFVAIVGTSGFGKSTLLHMLGGLDRPSDGIVMVDGQEIFSLKDEALTIFRCRKIGFVFQAYNLVPVLNVYENIVLPIELDGGKVNKEFAQQIVQTLGLDERLDALPNQLSASHDVDYTVCAYVTVLRSMSFRYYTTGYSFVLPIEKLNKDSQHECIPMFYLFNTPDEITEASTENYLTNLTADDLSGLMYESKATLRAEFEGFQNMFLLLGGLLCAIIGLVGILNFFNAIMTGILSRKREFAVLQAVGMTNKQLKAMLVYEGLFYALSSALSALVLSFVINPLIGDLMENMFWFFSAKFTIVPVIIAMPIFALLGWLIPYVIYYHTAKYSIVEQLSDT